MSNPYDETRVRAAEMSGVVRYILGTSMTLSVIAMALTYILFAG